MAGLRNADGQIVIDEQQAEEDIRKLRQAMSKMSEAREKLNPSGLDENSMRGDTKEALAEALSKITKELSEWEDSCKTAIQYINQTVSRYRRIDQEYARRAGK